MSGDLRLRLGRDLTRGEAERALRQAVTRRLAPRPGLGAPERGQAAEAVARAVLAAIRARAGGGGTGGR